MEAFDRLVLWFTYVKKYPIPGNDEQRKVQTNPNQVMLWNLINVLENLWNTSFKLISPLVTIIVIRRQRHLKYLIALKKIQHLSRLLDLVEPKFGKVKKSYSKFQGRITKPQLTWKQHADVVYFLLHPFLGIETLISCLECSNCKYPNICSAPWNFVMVF